MAGAAPASGSAVFAVSPDDILVSTRPPDHISARNVLRGTVVSKQESDAGDWIRVAAGGIEWTVRLTRSAAVELHLAPGSDVWLAVKTHTLRRLR
jgi:molybdopterin-binding protein